MAPRIPLLDGPRSHRRRAARRQTPKARRPHAGGALPARHSLAAPWPAGRAPAACRNSAGCAGHAAAHGLQSSTRSPGYGAATAANAHIGKLVAQTLRLRLCRLGLRLLRRVLLLRHAIGGSSGTARLRCALLLALQRRRQLANPARLVLSCQPSILCSQRLAVSCHLCKGVGARPTAQRAVGAGWHAPSQPGRPQAAPRTWAAAASCRCSTATSASSAIVCASSSAAVVSHRRPTSSASAPGRAC